MLRFYTKTANILFVGYWNQRLKGRNMINSFKNKTAIVTGASNGIGMEIGKKFLKAGANVVFSDYAKFDLESLISGISSNTGNAHSFYGSMQDDLAVNNLIATTINKFVGSIPILGDILVGKKTGEGVFGVSFKLKGPPKDIKTSVNPIKTLTPRFITRTLEKIKKTN